MSYFFPKLRFEISVVINFVSLVPKRRHVSHKFYQIGFVHCTPDSVLTTAGVWPNCRLETNLVCFEPTVGSCWEKTRQRDRVQCSSCDKPRTSAYFLRICWQIKHQSGRVTTLSVVCPDCCVVTCRFWLQCSHGLLGGREKEGGSWSVVVKELRVNTVEPLITDTLINGHLQ
jgi:hypothetical protein